MDTSKIAAFLIGKGSTPYITIHFVPYYLGVAEVME